MGNLLQKINADFFNISRGSAMECAGCLDILEAKKIINHQKAIEGKSMLHDIVNMLMGLIKSNSNRAYNSDAEYF